MQNTLIGMVKNYEVSFIMNFSPKIKLETLKKKLGVSNIFQIMGGGSYKN